MRALVCRSSMREPITRTSRRKQGRVPWASFSRFWISGFFSLGPDLARRQGHCSEYQAMLLNRRGTVPEHNCCCVYSHSWSTWSDFSFDFRIQVKSRYRFVGPGIIHTTPAMFRRGCAVLEFHGGWISRHRWSAWCRFSCGLMAISAGHMPIVLATCECSLGIVSMSSGHVPFF